MCSQFKQYVSACDAFLTKWDNPFGGAEKDIELPYNDKILHRCIHVEY